MSFLRLIAGWVTLTCETRIFSDGTKGPLDLREDRGSIDRQFMFI